MAVNAVVVDQIGPMHYVNESEMQLHLVTSRDCRMTVVTVIIRTPPCDMT